MRNKFVILLISLFCSLACVAVLSVSPTTANPTWVGLPAFKGGYEAAVVIEEPLGNYYDVYFRHSDWTRRSVQGRSMETAWMICPGHEGYIDLEIIRKVLPGGFVGDANYVKVDDGAILKVQPTHPP